MLVGFIHGVMNTDNMTISGETIDYGPCAFMDAFDPATVFSSIDHGGRYAYGNQPQIAQWNLARFGETLLPLFDVDMDAAVATATDVLQSFTDRYDRYWGDGMRAKLGLGDPRLGDEELIDDLLALLDAQKVDFTSCFRALSSSLRGDAAPARSLFVEPVRLRRMGGSLAGTAVDPRAGDPQAIADAMDRVNPVYIPRNHLVEEALAAATDDDLGPFRRLLDVLAQPVRRTTRPRGVRRAGSAELRAVPHVLRNLNLLALHRRAEQPRGDQFRIALFEESREECEHRDRDRRPGDQIGEHRDELVELSDVFALLLIVEHVQPLGCTPCLCTRRAARRS